MKPAEIKEMTPEDIKAKVAETTKELFNLRMRHSTNQLENPIRLRLLRRDVARLRTILAQKVKGA